MSNDELWRKRFQLFMTIRLFGLLTFLAGVVIAFTDLVQPGGHKLVGGLLAVMGALDAVFAPRMLKRSWERRDQ